MSRVLALKYRPRRFEELIGQDSISQTLSLALDSNRLSHAYLFSGLRGSGKTSTARIFAKSLLCDSGPNSSPCDVCDHCVMANESRHIDIIELDGASNRKIDDIRDLIEQTKYMPSSARFKVFIIDEVHMITREASNALLKTLEEPPPYVKFILATTDPLKLPATILSRTQHFRFKRVSHTNIVHHLEYILNKEEIGFEKEALDILARSGSGSLRDTLTLTDQAIIYSKNFVDTKTVSQMLGLIDPSQISHIFDTIFKKDTIGLIEILKELESYESEMIVDELIIYLKNALFEKDHRFTPLIIERFFRILSDSKALLNINADGGFVLSLVLFKMIEALKIKDIDEMIESLESSTLNKAAIPIERDIKIALTPAPEPMKSQFEQLLQKIELRDATLFSAFSKNIEYISFENSTLTWESCAEGEDREILKNSYGIIRQFVREIYGEDTAIKSSPCTKEPAEIIDEPITTTPTIENTETTEPFSINESEPASMIEDIEVGVGSCVSSCDETSTKELDGSDIANHPMIQKAQELFEPTQITIQSKV